MCARSLCVSGIMSIGISDVAALSPDCQFVFIAPEGSTMKL